MWWVAPPRVKRIIPLMYWRTSQQAGTRGGIVTNAVPNVAAMLNVALFLPPVFVTGMVPLGV